MACQHKELHHRLGDAEKLRLSAQSAISKHQALDNALVKAKARSKHWEREVKVGPRKTGSAERDESKEEAQLARSALVAGGDAKALAVVEAARQKAEA